MVAYIEPKTVAWRDFDNRTGTPAPWSKRHYTLDNGKTTVCGQTVPESYDSDEGYGRVYCKRCEAKRKRGTPWANSLTS